ncbi:UDP-N-acetylmuramoyl-L-alanyl-D-glutamate--2,6-diaminopimelate ligase [Caldilinea sp.]|uniref:UDP-N-acetylmuramoyl-L-alanyl-D-glutamate--2, 6-diaminopimelate ligase n=1 Tax=Caldilinea sp. TaxID=2293560 RepID=UPI002BA1EF4D|nr:UDP-N-acetylmuramoyl-L-alanyl-D-glutamate--2,6-diaminopimelate ligase [Caldilinea sp.]
MITLSQLLEVFPDERFQVYSQAALGVSIDDVTADSRLVRPGSLFVAVAGGQHDGHRYIEVALKQGAAAVVGALSGEALRSAGVTLPETVPYIQVGDSRRALALASAAVSDFPSRKLAVAGITGTDGKTTTSSILESILQAATSSPAEPSGRVGVITTVGARIRGQARDTGLHVTTPDAPDVQRLLRDMVDAGCRYAVVESTSHGLQQQRVAGVDFDVAAVTNITHEHLDYHGTRDAYVAAKAILFRALFSSAPKAGVRRAAVLNADDPGSYLPLLAVMHQEASLHGYHVPVRCYGLATPQRQQRVDVVIENIRYETDATRFDVHWWGGCFAVASPLIGEFNVYNVACAATAALVLEVAPAAIQAGIASMPPVLGRMQRMDAGQPFLALVDFAHTPVSLERALLTLRPLVGQGAGGAQGRLIAVFGSAGLRDRAKRYLMGEAGGRLADFTVITAEDPRTEDLTAICREIERGVNAGGGAGRYCIVEDRAAAIQHAVDMARAGDVVVAFGKGHERSMCFGELEYPWSDQDAMMAALARRPSAAPAA